MVVLNRGKPRVAPDRDQGHRVRQRATPGQVPEETLRGLAIVDGPVAALPGLIALLFYARYRITRASYETTRARLLDARAARGGRMSVAPAD